MKSRSHTVYSCIHVALDYAPMSVRRSSKGANFAPFLELPKRHVSVPSRLSGIASAGLLPRPSDPIGKRIRLVGQVGSARKCRHESPDLAITVVEDSMWSSEQQRAYVHMQAIGHDRAPARNLPNAALEAVVRGRIELA